MPLPCEFICSLAVIESVEPFLANGSCNSISKVIAVYQLDLVQVTYYRNSTLFVLSGELSDLFGIGVFAENKDICPILRCESKVILKLR